MKKIILCLVVLLMSFSFASCTITNDEGAKETLTMVMPTGTPALGVSSYAVEAKTRGTLDYEVVAGPDGLIAAFTNKSKDIIIAPVNLGAKMHSVYGDYGLYKTFVWGNLYLASKGTLNSLEDINNKTVVLFGKGATPDIVMKAILKNNPNLKVTLEYTTDVAEANKMLMTGKAEIVLTAEPALSKIKSNPKLNISTIDLQEEWAKMTNKDSYPQAGIFVKKSIMGKKIVKDELAKMTDAIKDATVNPLVCANAAVTLHASFKALGADVLVKAIPNCHYQILESDKEAVNYYLQMMIDLGFGKQVGGKLPSDEFYLK